MTVLIYANLKCNRIIPREQLKKKILLTHGHKSNFNFVKSHCKGPKASQIQRRNRPRDQHYQVIGHISAVD